MLVLIAIKFINFLTSPDINKEIPEWKEDIMIYEIPNTIGNSTDIEVTRTIEDYIEEALLNYNSLLKYAKIKFIIWKGNIWK